MKAAAKKGATKRPRPQVLKGMEDSRIKELDDAAQDYADIRDRRNAVEQEEGDLKLKVKGLMHKHHKKEYKYGGITVSLVEGEEDVKVKIRKADLDIEED